MITAYQEKCPIEPQTKTASNQEIELLLELDDEQRVKFVAGYFEHYGIDMPDAFWKSNVMGALLSAESKTALKKALDDSRRWAIKWHNENTPTVKVEGVTRATLFKVVKRTAYGTRYDEMGVKGSTLKNLKAGFISVPCLRMIIDKTFRKEPPEPSVAREFNDTKRKFIASQLEKLIKEELQ